MYKTVYKSHTVSAILLLKPLKLCTSIRSWLFDFKLTAVAYRDKAAEEAIIQIFMDLISNAGTIQSALSRSSYLVQAEISQ